MEQLKGTYHLMGKYYLSRVLKPVKNTWAEDIMVIANLLVRERTFAVCGAVCCDCSTHR